MQITLNETLKKMNKSQYKLAQETGIACISADGWKQR